MTQTPKKPVFLERAGYHRRRLYDAARLLPFLGGVLWMIPLLWNDTAAANARAVVYIFAVWVVMIGLSFLIAHLLRRADQSFDDDSIG